MKGIKIDNVFNMLEECWNVSKGNTYRDFIKSIANVDCILLQIWLEKYVTKLWNVNEHVVSRWKINNNVINSWNFDIDIKDSIHVPKFMRGGTYLSSTDKDIFDVDDFSRLKS